MWLLIGLFIEKDMSNMMKFDMQGVAPARIYKLLGALVIPRPIALVSTVNPEGKVNAAPISFFNVMGTNPPIVVLCPSNREDGTPKDTALNIHSTHEFVVNLVDEAMGEAMVKCAKGLPHGESELDFAGLTAAPSSMVKPPRVVEAPWPSSARKCSPSTSAAIASSSARCSACTPAKASSIPPPGA